MRRIIENLVYKTYDEYNNVADESDFKKMRMIEKMNLLKEYLPDFLVENKIIYGLLSKGIHELDEQECIECFDVLKDSIFLILDEKIELKNKENKKLKISKELQRLNSLNK